MRKIIASVYISLDGVRQGPGGPTEDPTNEFKYCGWLPPDASEEGREKTSEIFTRSFDLLLGRRTYEIFAAFWPFAEGPVKPMGELFDGVRKDVVTHSEKPLRWQTAGGLPALKRSPI